MNAPCMLANRGVVVGERVAPDRSGVEDQPFYLHFRFDDQGRVRHIAYSSKRESADLRMMLSFTCELISRLLQIGWSVAEIASIGPDKYISKILQRADLAERLARMGEP